MNSPDLREVCRAACEAARRAGADEAEAYAETNRGVSAKAEQNDIGTAEAEDSMVLGLRVLVRGAVGFACVNRDEESALAQAAATAVALARAGSPEDGVTLASPMAVQPIDGLWDPAVAAFTVGDAVERCRAVLTAAQQVDPRVSIDGAEVAFGSASNAVVNSRGVSALESQTQCHVSIFGMAVDGDDVSSFDHDVDASVTAAALAGAGLGKAFGQRLLSLLGARAYDGPAQPRVVLAPEVLWEILLGPLLASLDGDAVRQGKSRLGDKLGQQVAHAMVSVLDDPLAPGDVAAEAFDREGRPHRATPIVESGRLLTLLHNTDSARRLKQDPTGHAAGTARSLPGIGVTRVLVAPGQASLEDLLAEAGDGLYVGRFSGSVDEVSGDFSGVAKCSFRVRGGKLVEPLKETTVAGNAFDVLKDLLALTVKRKVLPGQVLPHALVSGVDVAGAG